MFFFFSIFIQVDILNHGYSYVFTDFLYETSFLGTRIFEFWKVVFKGTFLYKECLNYTLSSHHVAFFEYNAFERFSGKHYQISIMRTIVYKLKKAQAFFFNFRY